MHPRSWQSDINKLQSTNAFPPISLPRLEHDLIQLSKEILRLLNKARNRQEDRNRSLRIHSKRDGPSINDRLTQHIWRFHCDA